MSNVPGRNTKAAESSRRWTWGGHGTGGFTEKDSYGRFIDDVVFVFAELSVLSLPALYHVLTTTGISYGGIKGSTMIAWMAMVLVGALLRGGWLKPLGSDVRGWVSLTPELVAFRLGYYNLVLLVAGYGGGFLGSVTPLLSASFSLLVGAVGIAVFPRLAEVVAARLD